MSGLSAKVRCYVVVYVARIGSSKYTKRVIASSACRSLHGAVLQLACVLSTVQMGQSRHTHTHTHTVDTTHFHPVLAFRHSPSAFPPPWWMSNSSHLSTLSTFTFPPPLLETLELVLSIGLRGRQGVPSNDLILNPLVRDFNARLMGVKAWKERKATARRTE
jgi:hypothetical protein